MCASSLWKIQSQVGEKLFGRWKNLSIRLTAMPGTLLGVPGACQFGAGQSSVGAGGRGVGEVGSRNYKDLNVTTEEGRTPWAPNGLQQSGKAAWRKRLLKKG